MSIPCLVNRLYQIERGVVYIVWPCFMFGSAHGKNKRIGTSGQAENLR